MRDVTPAEAIGFLTFILAWAGGDLPVFLDGADAMSARVLQADRERLAERAARWDFEQSRQVEVGLPRVDGRAATSTTVLWAWLESREQVLRAGRRFRPLPSLVLKMGASCRRLCLWALREEVPYVVAEASNRRLAYALHAPQKYAPLAQLRIPLPGTFLRVGRRRPSPVLVTRMEFDVFTRSQVVARLKDPPAPFMQRLREGRVSR